MPISDLAENPPSFLARIFERDLPDIAERNATMLRSDLVLGDEGPMFALIASPNPNAEAGHGFVEHNVFRLALRQQNPSHLVLCDFHKYPFGKTPGRSKRSSQVF